LLVQLVEQPPEQLPLQLPEHEPVQPPQEAEQPNAQPITHPAACAAFGLIMPRPKKAAAVPARAFFDESSRNLRRVTFLFSFSMIISFTLGHEKPI
jgi:hypothetical protein